MIFVVRVTAGRENQVMEKIVAKVKKEGHNVYAVMHPREVKGYIFVEAAEEDDVRRSLQRVRNVRGIVGTVNLKDISHFLEKKTKPLELKEGDIVEIVAGPFRGERAKVRRANMIKEEAVVELLEAAVPIPITVKMEDIRLVKKEGDENA